MSKTFIGATAATAAATAAVLALGGLTAPANAAGIRVTDPADLGIGVDLRAVRVSNGDENLVIVLTHTNLRRFPKTGAGGSVFIDTDRANRGPELVFVGGYSMGTDYILLHTEGFGQKKWGERVTAFHKLTLDYDTEKTRMTISRKALGGAGKVRVAVRVSGSRPDGTERVDWLGEPRSFTRWVAQG